jgi:hypothetical protein
MRKPEKSRLKEIHSAANDFPFVKWALYGGVAVLSLYAFGKLFSASAYCIRGFNDFRSAIKGK